MAAEAKGRGITRSAVCMERAAALGRPVIAAVGNAPTALMRIKELAEEGRDIRSVGSSRGVKVETLSDAADDRDTSA